MNPEESQNLNSIFQTLRDRLDSDTYGEIKQEIQSLLGESPVFVFSSPKFLSPPGGELTSYGEVPSFLSLAPLGRFNPSDVTMQQVDMMRNNGLIQFVLAIRKMPITSIFRRPRGTGEWRIVSDDKHIKTFLEAAFDRIRMRFVRDVLDSLDWGFVPMEKVFGIMNAKQLGIRGNNDYWVYLKVKPNHPKTVTIQVDDQGNFTGYTQRHRSNIQVPPEKAIIITHNKKYGNLYGESALIPIFPFWFWFEVITRAMLRYLERAGTPTTITTAPQQAKITKADGSSVDALDYALQLAVDIQKSSAAALPSDTYRDSRQKMWSIEYLEDRQRGTQFVNILQWIGVQIMRAGLLPERVATQDTSTGSYGMSQTHFDVFMQTEETLLYEIVEQINDFLIPPLVHYNFGADIAIPPLTTDGLDRSEMDRMFNLLKVLVNVHPSVMEIDLKAIGDMLNIPFISETGVPKFGATPGMTLSILIERFLNDYNKEHFLDDRHRHTIRMLGELITMNDDPDFKNAIKRLLVTFTPEKIKDIVGDTLSDAFMEFASDGRAPARQN